MNRFHSYVPCIILECQCVQLSTLNNFADFRIFNCGERNQKSKIVTFFRLTVCESKDFTKIISYKSQKYLILLY